MKLASAKETAAAPVVAQQQYTKQGAEPQEKTASADFFPLDQARASTMHVLPPTPRRPGDSSGFVLTDPAVLWFSAGAIAVLALQALYRGIAALVRWAKKLLRPQEQSIPKPDPVTDWELDSACTHFGIAIRRAFDPDRAEIQLSVTSIEEAIGYLPILVQDHELEVKHARIIEDHRNEIEVRHGELKSRRSEGERADYLASHPVRRRVRPDIELRRRCPPAPEAN